MEINEIYPELEEYKDSFPEYNNKILQRILADNADTEFGRTHGFDNIASPEEYRKNVRVTGYDDYRPYVARMAKGEKGLLSAYEPYCLLETSGSTDAGKLIPISREALSRYGNVMDRYPEVHLEKAGGKRLFISFLQTDLEKGLNNTDTVLFTASYYRFLLEMGFLDTESLAGGRILNFFPSTCDYIYAKVWLALLTRDLSSMETVYLYDLVIFFHYLEDNCRRVIEDMEAGVIPEEINLPGKVRDYLLALTGDRDRIEEVRRECERGYDGIASRLWPDLKLVSGIGSKAFQSEEISVKKYIRDLPIWHYIYAASECLMAVPEGVDSYEYILYPGTAYYEFRTADEDGNKTVDVSSLVEGECYEMILTTFSGFYRYAMGDIIKVKGFYGTLPIINFQYRKNLVMNIAGEKLDMKTLDKGVRVWSMISGLQVWQYYFYEDYSRVPACYHGIIALDSVDVKAREELSSQMDKCLRGLSVDYNDLRMLGSISGAKISFVDKDKFLELKDNKSKKGQPKPLNIIN